MRVASVRQDAPRSLRTGQVVVDRELPGQIVGLIDRLASTLLLVGLRRGVKPGEGLAVVRPGERPGKRVARVAIGAGERLGPGRDVRESRFVQSAPAAVDVPPGALVEDARKGVQLTARYFPE